MDKKKGKSGIVKWIIIALVIIAAIVAGILIFLNSQKLSATTMRLLKIQGIVKLFDKEKEKTITDNLRLANGNVLNTETESLASIALDDTKIVTVNDSSRAEFLQNGKKLNINLTAGSLFFNVTQKLAADESFDIRTSNMVVGIRGTSGLVCVDEDGNEVLYITDGEVEVVGTNPVTGEQKTITVKAGQKITVYLYNDREKDSIMFELEPVADVDLIKVIRDRLIEDEALLDRVCKATGWDKNVILGMTSGSSDSGSESTETEASTAEESTTEGEESDTTVEEGTDGGTTQEQTTDDTGTEEPEGGESENAAGSSGQAKAPSLLETEVKGVDEENGNLILNDNSEFNPDFYYASNEDVAREIGNDPEALLEHYLTFGQEEGRAGTSQDAKAAEQKKQQEEKEKQQQYENWQDTLEKAEQEAREQQELEDRQWQEYLASLEDNSSSGGGDDSSSEDNGSNGYTPVGTMDGETVYQGPDGNYYVMAQDGTYERVEYRP